MKTFFRRLIWNLISVPFYRSINWTLDDRNSLDAFFKTGTGAKFLEFLRQHVASITFNAVYQKSERECGRATGFQDLLAVIHRLRRFPPESTPYVDEDVEPLASQKTSFDGRRFSIGEGISAIR